MFFPYLKEKYKKNYKTAAFGGLNRTDDTAAGELAEMKNMSSDKYPFLSPCLKKEAIQINSDIKKISGAVFHGKEDESIGGFTGTADGAFYYRDEKIPFAYSFMEISEDGTELINASDRIIIAPQMYCYEYKNPLKNDSVYPLAKGVYDGYITVVSAEEDGEPITLTKDNNKKTWADEGISAGDSLMLETDEEYYSRLNVYEPPNKYDRDVDKRIIFEAIVESADDFTLKVRLYNKDGEAINVTDKRGEAINREFSKTLRVYRRFPRFKNICLHMNRLWATTSDGESIYASAPGEFHEFSRYKGLSTDSWYVNVGEYGGFTGITELGEGIVAFKENTIYHIYGDRPSNFGIAKKISGCGCIDARSVCRAGTSVIFAGGEDIYEYSGGVPSGIGKKLNIGAFKTAAAFADNKKYYISVNSEEKLFVYNRENGLWHIEGDFDILGGIKQKNTIYFVTSDSMLEEKESTAGEWSAVLCDITEQSVNQKGVNDIFIRIVNGADAEASVWLSQDGGEFKLYGVWKDAGEHTFRVPVRFVKGNRYGIKISGKGECVIKDMQRSVYEGGGAFSRKG